MATTQDKAALKIVRPDAVMLELITREWPEGASQTFVKYSPLALSSGLAVAFVAPATALLAGWALSDGHNTTGASVSVALAGPEVEIEANMMGATTATNYVLLATDMGAKYDLAYSATFLGASSPGWALTATTVDPAVRVVQFPPIARPNEMPTRTAAGDTNARVRARAIDTKTHWNAT